jgi:hypothetical protein
MIGLSCRRLCAQVIRALLLEVEHVPEEELERTLGDRLDIRYMRTAHHTAAANVAGRARIENEVYSKVANYAALNALGGDAAVPFLHPVGCGTPRRFHLFFSCTPALPHVARAAGDA